MQKQNKKNTIKTIFLIIFLLAVIGMTIFMIPIIKMLPTTEGRQRLKELVESFGAWGEVAFLGIQITQVIIAFIPGEPIEIIGGMLFGTFGGLLLCLAGTLIGTVLIFYLVKWLGQSLVSVFVENEKLKKYKILNDEKRLETVVFILFLIPGTPKDALTYLVPLTKIKPSKYFILATIARIPSVISSTLVGSNIGKGNWLMSIIIFAATAAIGLVGILYNNRFISQKEQKKN